MCIAWVKNNLLYNKQNITKIIFLLGHKNMLSNLLVLSAPAPNFEAIKNIQCRQRKEVQVSFHFAILR